MIKAIVYELYDFQPNNSHNRFTMNVAFFDGTDVVNVKDVDVILDGISTIPTLEAAMSAAILAYANVSPRSYGVVESDIVGLAGMVKLLQAHIVAAPADAVTNYNVVTTLLGGLTGAVNTANTKQNDIATKLNAVIAALEANGILATS